jgi:hypothetical protein
MGCELPPSPFIIELKKYLMAPLLPSIKNL